LTISTVAEVRRALLRALEPDTRASTLLEARALAKIDLAGLQFLCAASRLAAARGKAIAYAPGGSARLGVLARAAGFGPGRGCAADCLCAGGAR
jgi:hypothetical protein